MSEVKKIATRDSYGAALVELGKRSPRRGGAGRRFGRRHQDRRLQKGLSRPPF